MHPDVQSSDQQSSKNAPHQIQRCATADRALINRREKCVPSRATHLLHQMPKSCHRLLHDRTGVSYPLSSRRVFGHHAPPAKYGQSKPKLRERNQRRTYVKLREPNHTPLNLANAPTFPPKRGLHPSGCYRGFAISRSACSPVRALLAAVPPLVKLLARLLCLNLSNFLSFVRVP